MGKRAAAAAAVLGVFGSLVFGEVAPARASSTAAPSVDGLVAHVAANQVLAGAPTPTVADGVGPGDWIEITQKTSSGTQLFGCTANFIWTDPSGGTYLGTAGHCLLPQPDLNGNGGVAEATAATLAGIDTDIQVCTANCWFGGQLGFLLDGTLVGTLKDLGKAGFYARQYPDNNPSALGDDFALIKLPAGLATRPSVPVWGGPTGSDKIQPGGGVCLYGNGEGVGETFPTKARSGVGLTEQTDGAGGPSAWYAEIPSFEGDSGSAVVNCTAGPNGLVGTTAVGLLTDLVVGFPGVIEGTTVTQAVSMTAQDNNGLAITLQAG